jgi:tape measure domain-containing protein
MATDLERLTVSLEANVKKFENELARARGVALKSMRDVESAADRAGKSVGDALSGALGRAAEIAAPALIAHEIRKMADEWQEASNKIKAAGVETASAGSALAQVADIAERSRTSFSATADLYARLTRSSKSLGASQSEVSVATEAVSKGLKISGASAAESQAAMVQLGQALQSGRLGGDELRSLLEGAPLIAQSVANEFGVTIGQLKDLGAAGQLSASRVFKALVDSADEVNAAFARTNPTVADAFEVLQTAATRYVGTSSAVNTATATLTAGLTVLAANFTLVANGATALGAVIAARLVAAGLAPLVTRLLAASTAAVAVVPALNGVNVALAATVAGTNAASLAMTALRGALAVVGGPVGAAILGIGVAALYASQQSAAAEERARQYAAALDEVRASADASGKAIDEHTNAVVRAAKAQAAEQTNKLTADLTSAQDDITSFSASIENAMTRAAAALRSRGLNAAAGAPLDELKRQFKSGEISAEDLKGKLFELANSNPRFQSIADQMAPLLEKLAGAIALVAKLRDQLAGIGGSVAAATDKAIEARIPNPTAGTTFDQDAGTARSDPVLRDLQGRGALQRAVADAEMDKTARKIKETRDKLREEIQTSGGTVDQAALDLAARRIVSAQETSSKGGATAKTPADRASSSIDRQIRAIATQRAELEAELQTIGKSNAEKEKAIALAHAETTAREAGTQVTVEQRRRIEEEVTAREAAAEAVRRQEDAQQSLNQTVELFGNAAIDGLVGVIANGEKASDVVRNLASSLAQAALQAALLGQGPLAGLFGTSAGAGKTGGLIGALGGLFGGSSGSAGATIAGGSGGLYATGGYTGPGGKYQPAGVVHKGEYVFDAAATRKIGVGNLEALRRGYADGGYVGPAMPSIPRGAAARGAGAIQVNVINQNGSDIEQRTTQTPNGPRLDVMVKDVVAKDFASNGPLARQFQAMYGVNRMGGRR